MSLSPETLNLVLDTQSLDTQLEWHLDLEHLRQISEGCPEFEQELLQIFLEDSRQHLDVLRQAIAQSNLPQIKRTTHHLKGSSANVGAKRVGAIAMQIENYAHRISALDWAEASTLNPDVTEMEQSLNQIQAWVQRQELAL
jgi:HPt (histidine-containing phosphotransfer) domain-containing protein